MDGPDLQKSFKRRIWEKIQRTYSSLVDLNRFLAQKGKNRLDICLSCENGAEWWGNNTGKIPQVEETVPKTEAELLC